MQTAADPAPPQVYREPTIGVVYLRAHEDAQGRLLGPQVMYQIVDPGGWNVGALDPGPSAAAAPRADGSLRAFPPDPAALVPARNAEQATTLGPIPQPPPSASPLLDPAAAAKTVITGLMRPGDRAQAEALAAQRPGTSALYDAEVGWLLVPKS